MNNTMTKVLPFVCVKNDLRSIFIRERRISRNKIFINFDFPCLLLLFVPKIYSHIPYILKQFSKIMTINLFALALVKVAFCRFGSCLSTVNPPRFSFTLNCFSEYIILQKFLVFFFCWYTIKGLAFFYSSFFIEDDSFSLTLDGFMSLKSFKGIVHIFAVFWVGIRRRVRIAELKEIRIAWYFGRGWKRSKILFYYLQNDLLHNCNQFIIE